MIEITGRRIALYARHSTLAQDRSVPAQIDRCRALASQQGATVVAEYRDEAVTGAVLDDRPEVQALLHHATQGEFDAVLFEDLSRVSRDQADIATIYKRLTYLDIDLVSVTEGTVNELHIGLKGTMNALMLKDLSDKTSRGQFAAVRNGRTPGGRVYGYDIVRDGRPNAPVTTGRRQINHEEATVVRRIFDLVEQGTPLRTICDRLNEEGIPSTRGKRWAANVLAGTRARGAGLLRRPIYHGQIVFGRTRALRDPVTGKRVNRCRPSTEWLSVPAPELAIISAEQFARVQAIIDPPKRRPRRTRPEKTRTRATRYITSGHIWCARCGGRITTAKAKYLVCRNFREHKTCDQRYQFRRDEVTEQILLHLVSSACRRQVREAAATQIARREKRHSAILHTIKDVDGHLADAAIATASILDSVRGQFGYNLARRMADDCERDIRSLRREVETLRTAFTTHPPDLSAADLASAAFSAISAASRRLRRERPLEGGETELLHRVILQITVAYDGPGRAGLQTRTRLDPKAVYELGVAENDRARNCA